MAPTLKNAPVEEAATISMDEFKALREEIERLRKENTEMKKRTGLEIQVTERGQVGIVFGNYTCRLFKTQWLKIFENVEQVKKFIVDNNDELA